MKGIAEHNKTTSLAVLAGVLTALIVALAFRAAGRIGITDPSVVVAPQRGPSYAIARRNAGYTQVEQAKNGEVSRTAERVNEALGVADAASLIVASELEKRRMPAGDADLIALMTARKDLLPPGISAGAERGTLETAHSVLVVRCRRKPVGVEVVALGKSREAGQAVLVRVPTGDRINGSGIWLCEKLDGVIAPQPFAPDVDLLAFGWQADALPPTRQ